MLIDESEIKKTIAIMKPDNELFEVRILFENKKIYSGYFRDAGTLVTELKRQSLKGANIYITLNAIHDACFDRSQKNKFEVNTKATTSDTDVVGYEWLMLDLDPKRPTGTSATDEQLKDSKSLGNKVFAYLSKAGFEKPLVAVSGNGVHLMYRIALKNTTENKELISKTLKTMNLLFGTEEIGVDVINFNPARVCKLYGTMAQKGSDSTERPHRMSKIIYAPDEMKVTNKEYLEQICKLYPTEPERSQKNNNYSSKDFNLEDWMSKYGLRYKTGSFSDGTKYTLECCPFDSNHSGKDACIFQSRNGAIGFHCFHNSCADKTWKDVRLLFEPAAYDREYTPTYTPNRKHDSPVQAQQKIVEKSGTPVFYTAKQISKLKTPPAEYIPTGFADIDKKMRGLAKGDLSIISGFSGSGKSSVISEMALNAIDKGFTCIVYSGELIAKRFMKWMYLQAAGKSQVVETRFQGFYEVPDNIRGQIDEWLGDRFYLYNNDYGSNFKAFEEKLIEKIEETKADLIFLDNLMTFDIRGFSQDKFDAQTLMLQELQRVCKKYLVHIALVAHPRKQMGFLRIDDISGSGNIRNDADNVFIVHRVNNDFKRTSKEMMGWKEGNAIYDCDNCIEIAKDRESGNVDYFARLWFERETKRLKNSPAEIIIYGWDKTSDGFEYGTMEETPFD